MRWTIPLIALLATACGGDPSPVAVGNRDAAYWHWGAGRELDAEEARALADLGCTTLYCFRGRIVPGPDGPVLAARGGGVPGPFAHHAVLRIARGCQARLDDATGAAALRDAVLAFRREHAAGCAGLQIDWDVATRRLPSYAAWLTALRARLPAGIELSCTGLLDWTEDAHLPELMRAVDCFVPQCYNTGVPADPLRAERLVAGGDLPRLIECLEAAGGHYRIGLPAFEQAVLWDAAGEPVSAALRVRMALVWESGLELVALRGHPERIAVWRAARDTPVGGLRIPAGFVLAVARPTAAGLRAQLASIASCRPRRCRGVAWFRLPAGGADRALPVATVAAAYAGDPAAPRIDAHYDPARRVLVIANRGPADACPHPGRIAVFAGGLRRPPRLLAEDEHRVLPARDGVPCAPGHADGVLVRLPFLAAGEHVAVADLERRPGSDLAIRIAAAEGAGP